MRERKELVEATELRARIAYLSLHRRIFRRLRRRWRCRWRCRLIVGRRLAVLLGDLGILSTPRILDWLGLGFLDRRRTEARRARYNVQHSSNVRRGAFFIVVLCSENKQKDRGQK